jgi:hypothetical protein
VNLACVMLQYCYAHITVALPWCYRGALVVLRRCRYKDATTFLLCIDQHYALCYYCAIIVPLRYGVCTRTVCIMLSLGIKSAAMLWCIAIETSLKHTYIHTHTHKHNTLDSICLLCFPQIISLISVNQFCMVCTADCNAVHAGL